MEDKLYIAIVTAIVSIFGILVSFITTIITNSYNRKKLFKEIESKFSLYLHKERLETYSIAYEIIGKIKRFKSPIYITSFDKLQKIEEELSNWSSGKGGLLMSGSSILVYRKLLQALKKQPEKDNNYSEDQAKKLWTLRSEFKRELRNDILQHTPNKDF